jgi:GNAT superfamily N-acetyltransferase
LEIDEKDRRAIHLLARIGERPVATGRITLDGKHGEIARIAVLPDYRRNGLGAAIVRRLEAEGRDRGVRHFELTPHRHLHAFYLRLGYQGDETAGEIAGHPLIRMHKRE